jgi:hypothetical protein
VRPLPTSSRVRSKSYEERIRPVMMKLYADGAAGAPPGTMALLRAVCLVCMECPLPAALSRRGQRWRTMD